jgi:hypothetical protein
MRAASGGVKPAASGCGGAGRRSSPVYPILGSGARFGAQETSMRGARAREANWGGGTARRCGQRAPATAPRRRGARDRQLATPAGASPSCASPGWLHSDERAATAAETGEQRRQRSRVRVSGRGAAQEAAARVSQVGRSRAAACLK